MRKYIDHAERHLPECEVDFENKTYLREIQSFWAGLHVEIMSEKDGTVINPDEAEELLSTTKQQLEDHHEKMDNDNVKMVEEEMDALKKNLEIHDDNKALLTASDKLREVCRIDHSSV